jgi:hypothetical protein
VLGATRQHCERTAQDTLPCPGPISFFFWASQGTHCNKTLRGLPVSSFLLHIVQSSSSSSSSSPCSPCCRHVLELSLSLTLFSLSLSLPLVYRNSLPQTVCGGIEYSPSILEPVRPGALSPDRALCLPTFRHFVIVNKTSLSLSLSLHNYIQPIRPSRRRK